MVASKETAAEPGPAISQHPGDKGSREQLDGQVRAIPLPEDVREAVVSAIAGAIAQVILRDQMSARADEVDA